MQANIHSSSLSYSPNAALMPTYNRLPVALSHGQGCTVWDTEGKAYLDALAGIAVNTLGHAHPKLVAALQDQVGKLIHTSNYYHIPVQEALAAALVERSGLSNVFFCNSGLEANEAALKMARKHGHNKGVENAQIVVCEKAFHGRSIATLSATANAKVQDGFTPLVKGFVRVALNDIAALQALPAQYPNITAIFLETIQGEGGVNPARKEYLQAARALCDANDWLLILDEVQCGTGRTGKWFAHQWADIQPDIMPLAKGLGSGVPIGAVLAGPKAASLLQPGSHGSTFGGNPLAMRAALQTIQIMEDEGLLNNAYTTGVYLQKQLRTHLAPALDDGRVLDIRGQGLMIGIETQAPCTELVTKALHAGLLINVTAESVIRLLPPLILTCDEANTICERLCPLILALPATT